VYEKIPSELREAVLASCSHAPTVPHAGAGARGQEDRLPGARPSNLHRLRTHPDKTVAARANAVIGRAEGSEQKEKDLLIGRSGGGRAAGQRRERPQAVSGQLRELPIFKVGGPQSRPQSHRMGAHGAGELLVISSIRTGGGTELVSASIETKDDLNYDGIIERENTSRCCWRNANGDFTNPQGQHQIRSHRPVVDA